MIVGALEVANRKPGLRLAFGSGMLCAATVAAEMAAIVLVSLLTGAAWHLWNYQSFGDLHAFAGIGLMTGLLYTLPFLLRSEYQVEHFLEGGRATLRILNVWSYAFFSLAVLAFLTKTTGLASRGWLALFYVLGGGVVVASHAAMCSSLRFLVGNGYVARQRLMVVGAPSDVDRFLARHCAETTGIEVVATTRLSAEAYAGSGHGSSDRDGQIASAVEWARMQAVTQVLILPGPHGEAEDSLHIANRFLDLPVAVHLGRQALVEQFPQLHVARVGKLQTLALRSAPLTPFQLCAKRAFDIAVATIGLVLLAPGLLAVAIAIRLDSPGPVFFRQRRRGFNEKEFRIWKFRTMTTLDDGERVVQATTNDARVTRIGRHLRRLNIDELPQLINVLKGDMSLVGPRPHAVAHDKQYARSIRRYSRRLNMKPGITGWAQVNGFRGETRSEHAMRSRIAHDLYYIDNWSLAFDIYIVALTAVSPKAFRNAG